uniref:Uncharacterized protein n=1 Tax=Plectus sambesii TaxID=2011161 RepID=A0A914WGA6_9BILA
MAVSTDQRSDSRILRFAHTDQSLCWFTLLPDRKGIFCRNQSSSKFSVLNLDTLVAKQNLSVDNSWIRKPVSRNLQDGGASFIIPGFETVEISSVLGGRRTVLIELIWSRGTTTAYVKTSFVDFKRSEVTTINQLELPVRNSIENWNFDLMKDNGCKDNFFCIFYWQKYRKTALSLARVSVTSKLGDVKCEAIANERLVGECGWSTGGAFITGGNVYLLNDGGKIDRMLQHSFDGTRTTLLTLKSYLGEYPFDGYTIQSWFEDCFIAFFRPSNMPGRVWALDVAACQWLDLGVLIADHLPCGHNKLEISKEGKAYLLAMCASGCSEKAHVYTFNIKYRLADARAKISIEPPPASAAAPPPYRKDEVESTRF